MLTIEDLGELEDITDTLVFHDEPDFFTEENVLELIETTFKLIDEFIENNPTVINEPTNVLNEIILEELNDIFFIQLEDDILNDDYLEDELNDILENAINIYIDTFYNNNNKDKNIDVNNINIGIKIQKLREIPQPIQRTPEWYSFRWNLITASNAWKAFESQSAINQLIYEKCQPLKIQNDDDEVTMVNTNTPLHWGQKYEPLSVLIYEQKYNTKVEDFGCIQHSTYKFLGASPDGINVDTSSERYGRMLEIKNVVSREINGIPKKEYFTQMQLQMEVCDLNECDFLETKFVEYPDTQSFYNDTHVDDPNLTISTDGKTKGIILYFHTKEGKPFYSYKPLNVTNNDDIKFWEETELDKYEAAPYNYIFLKFIYWKLDVFSCILVTRNCEWFANHIKQLEKVWKTIEEERVSGYAHRAPNKKPKKDVFKACPESQGCFFNFTKIIKVETELNIK